MDLQSSYTPPLVILALISVGTLTGAALAFRSSKQDVPVAVLLISAVLLLSLVGRLVPWPYAEFVVLLRLLAFAVSVVHWLPGSLPTRLIPGDPRVGHVLATALATWPLWSWVLRIRGPMRGVAGIVLGPTISIGAQRNVLTAAALCDGIEFTVFSVLVGLTIVLQLALLVRERRYAYLGAYLVWVALMCLSLYPDLHGFDCV